VIVPFRCPCVDHQAALLDFVDRREHGPATAAALGHLDRCRSCEAELSGIAIAIAALRRLHREVGAVEPPADSWLHLRARVERRGDPWAWRATLGGITASALLVGVLVAPISFGRAPSDLPQPPWLAAEIRLEAAYLATIHTGDLPASRPPRTGAEQARVPMNHPPEIRDVRKEVAAANPPGRPPKPI
jgi:hypothetical protein